MTLVELLVGMFVGLLAALLAVVSYTQTGTVFRVDDAIARASESGRFAASVLSRDLRMAGMRGCAGSAGTPANLLAGAAGSYPLDFGTPLQGHDATGGGWSPALPAEVAAASPVAGSDVLTLRLPVSPGAPVSAQMAGLAAPLSVGSDAFAADDLVLVADCAAAVVFQVSAAVVAGGTAQLAHARAAGTPGNVAAELPRQFGPGASAWRVATRTYFVAPSSARANVRSLWVHSSPAYDGMPQPEELAQGVEQLAIDYGVDDDGDRSADRYVAAGQIADWRAVVGVKLRLLQASARDGVALGSTTRDIDGRAVAASDRRLRQVQTLFVTLRNQVP